MSAPNIPAPTVTRPFILDDYGIPKTMDGVLPWSYATERLAPARNYWVSTTLPDGRPHARPVWGVLVDGVQYFGGGPQTRWARNLAARPEVVLHLESGDEVVIVEGTVTKLTEENADPDLLTRIDDAYEAKYNMRHGTPVWQLTPRVAFGWTKFPDDTTKWVFESSE
ncbi:MAG TPA: pyridoxamine 5'-phosphate oxidase family protein [Aggregatilinea sp.]|uniref:pyridoxamine 5'-phosphate oxidase family protein n=1 Tax=Aggregatilinea sp. TaxID=2806333 RepID=UPI002BBB95AD|nr:pyridoxamine 5'-phosphate oxidase family protein [Aggregatilinea sp.]HML21763.1 pyridoxamine 5'-phosphate oxidase family protein [Aggregatilinea sp.]